MDANSREYQKISKEEIQSFQLLKNKRNQIIQNRHRNLANILKEQFPNNIIFAGDNMKFLAVMEQIELQSGQTTIIYYNNLVVNATFSELIDLADLNDGHIFGSNIGISAFSDSLQLDFTGLTSYKWSDEGVILYKENENVYIRDAKGFTTEMLKYVEGILLNTIVNNQFY